MAEQLSFSALFPPGQDDERYYRLDYSQYVDAEGTQLNLSASTYRSNPAARVRLESALKMFKELKCTKAFQLLF